MLPILNTYRDLTVVQNIGINMKFNISTKDLSVNKFQVTFQKAPYECGYQTLELVMYSLGWKLCYYKS